MATNMTTQYELIGNRIVQYMKSLAPSEGSLQKRLTAFLEKYSKAPLFIIGIDDSMYREWRTAPEADADKAFCLPFPTMVLDFPNGLLQKSNNPRMADSMIISQLSWLAKKHKLL